MKISKINDITILFGINEDEYRNLVKYCFESDRYVNKIQDVLSFNYPISTQDAVKLFSKKKNKLKLKQSIKNSFKNQSDVIYNLQKIKSTYS